MQARITDRRREAIAAVKALDLEPIRLQIMDAERGKGWTSDRTESAERGYRAFLTMLARHPEALERIVLSKDVDEFWHTHILHTMKYMADCERVFGTYLHHNPQTEARTSADIEATRQLYAADYGLAVESTEAAYCSAAVSAGQPAYCSAAVEAEQPAYCSAAVENAKPAYCSAAVTSNQPAYCSASVETARPAYCSAAVKPVQAAYCSAAVRREVAYCSASVGAERPAYCSASVESARPAYCSAAVKPVKAAYRSAAART